MPINRSPPASPLPPPVVLNATADDSHHTSEQIGVRKSPLQPCTSAPDVSINPNATERKKRKFEEDKFTSVELTRAMFASFSTKQASQYDDMIKKINNIIEQNVELKKSVELMSEKYDEFLSRITALEEGKKLDKLLIRQLENKIEDLERTLLSTEIEIRNVPKEVGETKDDLCNLVMNMGSNLKIDINNSDIIDVHRIKSKNNCDPIIVHFNSVIKKDKVIKCVKLFNRAKVVDEKLNTTHLKLKHRQPIFVTERLFENTKIVLPSSNTVQKRRV